MSTLNPKTVIGTWLHAEPKGAESRYPQVGGASSSSAFQDVYWRCVMLFFASSVRHNPSATHRLFTTVPSVPDVGSFSTSAFLKRLNVEVIQVPFTYLPPPGYYGAWRNQFYILDIIKYLDAHGAPDEQYVILTPTACLRQRLMISAGSSAKRACLRLIWICRLMKTSMG